SRPKPPVAIDHQAVDHVAGKRHAVARVLPRLAGVVRDVHLATAGAEEEGVGIGGIDDQGADVRAVERCPTPLPEDRRRQNEHRETSEDFTHRVLYVTAESNFAANRLLLS